MTATFYSSGTVSVTNASTTATLSVAVPVVVEVQPGDILAAGTGFAVIASINSARTQLTLARGWAAATVTAGDFEIILLADSIRTLNITSTLLADLRTGPLQGRFAAGTAGAPGVSSGAHQTSGLFWNANGAGLASNGVARIAPISGGLNLIGTIQHNGTALSSAATAVVTSADTDVTVGRLMRTRDHGLGVAITLTAGDNLNDLPRRTAFYFNPTGMNTPGNNYPVGSAGSLIQISDASAGRATQIFTAFATARTFVRALGVGLVWSPWAELYSQASILGNVSQSGGVPTGAVIQRGSNANGEFVRFADGTQICTHVLPAVNANTAIGNLFMHANILSWTYPASFSVAPVVTGAGGEANRWITPGLPGTSNCTFRLYRATSSNDEAAPVLMAVGRWF